MTGVRNWKRIVLFGRLTNDDLMNESPKHMIKPANGSQYGCL